MTSVIPRSLSKIALVSLMKAAQKGHFETVFLLWNSGADATTKDSYGCVYLCSE